MNGVGYSNWRLKNNDELENFKAKYIKDYEPQHMHEDMTLNRDRITNDNNSDIEGLFKDK